MIRVVLTLVLCASTLSCARGDAAREVELITLEQLAVGWSAGSADASCRSTGPRGEYLGREPGAQYCQWPTVTRGGEVGIVGGTRDDASGFSLLTWERTLRDAASVSRLADSLSAAFTKQGLLGYECPDAGRRWQTPGLGVHFSVVAPSASGLPRVLIQATTMPAALPAFLCPAAPVLPVMSKQPPRASVT